MNELCGADITHTTTRIRGLDRVQCRTCQRGEGSSTILVAVSLCFESSCTDAVAYIYYILRDACSFVRNTHGRLCLCTTGGVSHCVDNPTSAQEWVRKWATPQATFADDMPSSK